MTDSASADADIATTRAAIGSARRMVIKIGSSSLTTPEGRLDESKLKSLVATVAQLRKAGRSVVIVSSGAIASGIGPMGLKRRPNDLPTQQAVASVGQGILLASYSSALAEFGLTAGQVLLTADDVGRRSHYQNAQNTLGKLLELGVVPIVNENDTVATNEIRFGDNDRLAALVAHLIHADALVLLSDTDSLYDMHPSKSEAKAVTVVRSAEDLDGLDLGGPGSGVGSGGMVTKIEAARIASAAAVPVVLTSANQVEAAVAGHDVGTVFVPDAQRSTSRLLWLEYATSAQGTLTLDSGAVRAIVQSGASLLPVGVTEVSGDFSVGDPVDLVDAAGQVVARGISNFDSVDIPRLLGRSTAALSEELGNEFDRELVHRDCMVIGRR